MDGSSDSGWHRSYSFKSLNSSSVSNKNPIFSSASTIKSSCNKSSDISLREWLNNSARAVDSLECLHIFTQIVEIVNLAHSQGIVVHNVRPSSFVMSSFNRISFIESASCSDSGSNSYEDVSNIRTAKLGTQSFELEKNSANDSQMASRTSCLHLSVDNDTRVENDTCVLLQVSNVGQEEEKKHPFPMRHILVMENKWYISPEEVAGAPSSGASDIYRLGVLLFELFCTFSSEEEKNATMYGLRHRLFPPKLLLKWPKQASFCLWLLHPEPSSRPKMNELLQSEFLNELRDDIEEREAATKLKERTEEAELLLDFLLLTQQRKREAAANFHQTISFLSSDIEEVTKLQIRTNDDSCCSRSRKRLRPGFQIGNPDEFDQDEYRKLESMAENEGKILNKSSRLMRNFKKLESAYFTTRERGGKLSGYIGGSIAVNKRQSGWINSFLEGLSKYTYYCSLKVKANLKQGNLLNSSNLVCSLGFGRDGDFFATAGANKKIKVFEYDTILKENRDIHYPVVEMSSRSKLSSLCWNRYIKSQIASSNFEGVVQVWDVTRSQVITEMREHERRVWSVDYSLADPRLLASGSDDGSVKLWNINQEASVGTIRTKANVCCVQFPSDSINSLAFGSADHNIYYYDLRNSKMPLCTLIGHKKTVSYVKFLDSTNLVSASTDNTLKLWDLSMGTSRVLDCPARSFTGHTNVKNFVGLSVCEGYIATGSETNEVFIYHKAFPMPVMSFKFNGADPLSGNEVDDSDKFISSVCWHGLSATLVAANSMGNIKLLEMV